MIEIRRTHLRLTQHHRLIRSTHEHRPPLGIGMQRHRPDTVVVLGVEFLHSLIRRTAASPLLTTAIRLNTVAPR
ncbi:hypothetical protein BJF84_05855 [Rhodococcus sp. CUA-806]|nr:hypothetical protein BJF84_05855 [Rhodococcus sp. CUA-806]